MNVVNFFSLRSTSRLIWNFILADILILHQKNHPISSAGRFVHFTEIQLKQQPSDRRARQSKNFYEYIKLSNLGQQTLVFACDRIALAIWFTNSCVNKPRMRSTKFRDSDISGSSSKLFLLSRSLSSWSPATSPRALISWTNFIGNLEIHVADRPLDAPSLPHRI